MTEVKGSVELVRSADRTGISTLAGQGHEAMLDAPELFAREVTRFLAER